MAAAYLELLIPATYIPISDPILAQRANEIADAAKEDGRLDAICLGIGAIARAFFINVPYHLAHGTYNAVNLFSDEPVLKHYQDALINLIFTAISVIYIAAGIFYLAAFECFREAAQLPFEEEEDDKQFPRDLDRLEQDYGYHDDFAHIAAPILPHVNVFEEELYGQYGVQLRRMGYRVALDEYQRLLQSNFDIHIDQMLQTMEGWPKNESVDLLRSTLVILVNPKGEGYVEAIGQYKTFVTKHRELIASYTDDAGLPFEIDGEVKRISRAIATVRLMANIQGFSEDLVRRHTHPHALLTAQNFHELFALRNNAVRRAPTHMKMTAYDTKKRQLYGTMSWLDFFKEPDVPNLRGISQWQGPLGEQREILYLRHATPHITGAVIAPEYREFVLGKAERGEGVLYAAYQRLNDAGHIENEHVRCQNLIEFERENPNFYLLFHSVENDIFKRVRRTFAELKAALIDSFYQLDAVNANRLPLCFQEDAEYRAVMEELFDQVHFIFFDAREEINRSLIDHFGRLKEREKICEWQVCIMLFYYFQREDIKFRTPLPVTTEVNPCKDNFDRGGAQSITSDRARQHKLYGADVPSQMLEDTLSNILAPPIMGKGLSVIPKRINPSLAVSHLLAHLPTEKMEQFQRFCFNGWRLTHYGIEKREGQKALFLPQDARTSQEMIYCIRSLKPLHTVIKNDMVEENSKRYPTKEALLRQLNTILQEHARIEIDGVYYDGSQRWGGDRYDAQGILDLLIRNHNLNEERALKIIRQLEVQIFLSPMAGLKAAFDRSDLNLEVQQFSQPPHEVRICLTTYGDQFIVRGKKKFRLQNIENNSTLHIFNVTITLCIPKDEAQRETGEWSWNHA